MASITKRLCRPLQHIRKFSTNFYLLKPRKNTLEIIKTGAGLFTIGAIVIYAAKRYANVNVVYAARPRKHNDDEIQEAVKLTMREKRFIKFASVVYNGQLYMTPQDFLDSVVESEPRPRYKRRLLTNKDLEMIKNITPQLRHGKPTMFRNLKDKGIVSYTEYLFLLSILTKPQTGFRIAFNMFDTDGNEIVDKNEFLVMEKIFSYAWQSRHGNDTIDVDPEKKVENEHSEPQENDEGLQRRHAIDTTLMIHFFGKDGTKELKYDGFKQFMENLQHEVLELEFQEFSKGSDTISELDFAKILLRYTYLDTDEYEQYLGRLLEGSKNHEEINFQEFRLFYQFLNSLDDFSIAMRMYTLADHPISKDEFLRAVKICTGTCIPMHIIDTVFALFDVDGDGQLSYKEFIAIMKDRLHRGFKSQPRNEGWEGFKYCVKQEMKAP
ncbi:calcium uptake protein 3, mitochondrial isoform X3 [Chelonus insularis]|uniref:calcium uptake protein 3, mitochondrial isoform X3 n=1 Tax=Chelonus insularis TaxID=460826 RepID=UPI00158B4527|nr:calcium uptake protein 3, mitochondrial isoform X3 [Chelonus insularis]